MKIDEMIARAPHTDDGGALKATDIADRTKVWELLADMTRDHGALSSRRNVLVMGALVSMVYTIITSDPITLTILRLRLRDVITFQSIGTACILMTAVAMKLHCILC